MLRTLLLLLPLSGLASVHWLPADVPPLPSDGPVLCARDYLKKDLGPRVLRAAGDEFATREAWTTYANHARLRIQEGAGLAPWPQRTPLNARITSRRVHDGYSVENVALETIPGVFVGGNLYRPLRATGKLPAVLTTHGHTGDVKAPEEWARHGRFTETVQRRGATLARMGAVVLSLDMFGYGDSLTQFGPRAHRRGFAMTMQLWNAMRALDFLTSLSDVDASRLAVTGESGGGTQAFLLAALDERIAVSVPVVMVSGAFFGGCPCESGMPIHRSADHFVSNAMIAAMAAPRPQLLVSVGGDWTSSTPEVEYPFLRRVYALFAAEANAANVHLPTEGHNYGPSKRAALYQFVAERFGLPHNGDESAAVIEPPDALRAFTSDADLPRHALRTVEAAEAALRALQR